MAGSRLVEWLVLEGEHLDLGLIPPPTSLAGTARKAALESAPAMGHECASGGRQARRDSERGQARLSCPRPVDRLGGV